MRTTVVLAVLLLVPEVSTAQPAATEGVEVFGSLGVGGLTDDESFLGIGASPGLGVGYRWPGRLGVEVRAEWFDHERTFATSGVRFTASGARVRGRLLYHFREGAVEPYVAGALGYTRADRVSAFPDGRFESSVSGGQAGGAVGIRFNPTPRVSVRPEVEVLFGSDYYVALHGGVSVGWRF